jgi:hypothetical protein
MTITNSVFCVYVCVCVCTCVASVIQHEKRMRHIVLSSVACPVLPYFSTLSHKRYDYRKKLLHTKCVFRLFYLHLLLSTRVLPPGYVTGKVFRLSQYSLSETFLILRRIQQHAIINENWYARQVTVIPVRFS